MNMIPDVLAGLVTVCYCHEARRLATELYAQLMSRGSCCKLAGSPDMPLVIQCEICGHRGTILTEAGRKLIEHLPKPTDSAVPKF